MTDVGRLLRQGDPLRTDSPEEPGELSPAEAQVMRREMLDVLSQPSSMVAVWQRPIAVGALAMLMIAMGALAGHRTFPIPATDLPDSASTELGSSGWSGDVDCRQLQFSTPGGTRIIWIFDEKLRLQESMP
jgi:hypothetical protein